MKKIYITAIIIATVAAALLIAPALAKNDNTTDKCELPDLDKNMTYNGYTDNKDGTDDFAYVQQVGFTHLLYLDNKADRLEICDAWGHKRVCAIVIPTEMHDPMTGHKPTKVWVTAHSIMQSPALKFCGSVENPGISLVKTVNGEKSISVVSGKNVTYTYDVTNSGDVVLTDIVLVDDKLGAISCPGSVLAPSAHMMCTATSVINEDTLNNATVTGKAGGVEVSDWDTASVYVYY